VKLQMSFGENLINLRKQKGWSQDDLAENLNLSRQAISKWENDTSKPDIDNIKKISKVFSVTIDDLLNNDVVKDKAVTLNVKKQEKKEKTITIVKCMIIAVIILYIINVIFKFASLLIIVNGIQKYANLSNYHYVITTYDETGLVEKEEGWFKDGVSKTINIIYGDVIVENITCIDYSKKSGYTIDSNNNSKKQIDMEDYLLFHNGFENGGQLISKFPNVLKNSSDLFFITSFNLKNNIFKSSENCIIIETKDNLISLCLTNLLPKTIYYKEDNALEIFRIEVGNINQLNI